MSTSKKLLSIVIAGTLVAGGAACGGDDDARVDDAVEDVLGDDVDIDTESGTVRITHDDGTVSEYGPTTELPDDWPSELDPPDEVTLQAATRQVVDGVTSLVAFGDAPGTVEQYFEGIKDQFRAAGLEIVNESSASGSGSEFATVSAAGDGYDASATITGGDVDGQVTISMTVIFD